MEPLSCGFAYPGTYGHECRKPAEFLIAVKAESTKSGLFYTGRCADCIKAKGPDNENILETTSIDLYDPEIHKNAWK